MELSQNNVVELEKGNKKDEFLNSTLWKTINSGIDLGLRYLLPDIVEDEIIDLKNNMINLGLKDGIKKSINDVIETGRQTIGVLTGNFQNIGQVQSVVKNGGIIDKVSDVLNTVIQKGEHSGKINPTIGNIIIKGKNSLLDSVERNLEATMNNQISKVSLVDESIKNWKEFYDKKDFDGMEKEFKIMEKNLKNLVPLENTLQNARFVENIHQLIKNNDRNFDISEEALELANKL